MANAREPNREAAGEPLGCESLLAGAVRSGVIVFLVSLALLCAQVTVTRLLAYRFFYHFVFFVISLAQLGLAAAGAWVYASRRSTWRRADLAAWLAGLALLPLALLACYGWLSPAPNLSFAKLDGPTAYPYLAALAVLLVALNFCGGMVLTILFTTGRRRIGSLYACDLAGAACGCLASVGAMLALGPIRAFLAAGLAALAALLLVVPAGAGTGATQRRRSAARLALGLVLLALLGAGFSRADLFDPDVFHPERIRRIERSEWNHIARTDAPRPGVYVIDGDASTDLSDFRDGLQSPEYSLLPERPAVAIVGVGAGPQLVVALTRRSASVLAVDINPTILRWATQDDREINRGAFSRPEVRVVLGEGRHVLRSTDERFDLIVMHAIDTWTASAQGAYSLTENFLYTSEAMRDFLSRLRPGGIVSIRRWLFWPPRENLRLFTTVLDALERAGHEEPARHVVVLAPTPRFREIESRVWGYLLFSDRPFSDERLDRLDRHVAEQGWAYLYRPDRPLDTPFQQYVAARDRQAFLDDYPYLVAPARDSNPFFFQFAPPWSPRHPAQRISSAIYETSSTVLVLCLALASGLTLLLLGVPLFLRRRDLAGDRKRTRSLVYFGCLGVGFMAVELPAIQIMTLFLGHPTYALSVVLLGLLAAAGIGSQIMGRAPAALGSVVLPAIGALALASAVGLLPLVHALIHLPGWARVLVTLGYLLLVGVPLGMPFVAGVRWLDPDRPHQVAWAWAANGAAAVVGSCALMVLLVYGGSSAAFVVAAACYLVAWVAGYGLARGAVDRTSPAG